MGIHFVCHHCSYALHVKDFQAGKRGKCPSCKGSFRIPMGDASYSSPLDESSNSSAVLQLKQAFQTLNAGGNSDLDSDSSGSIAVALETQPETNDIIEDRNPSAGSLPPALAEALDSKWFVRPPSGGQFGPAPSQLLLSWVAESRITADSLLWREGLPQWKLASELLPELFPSPNIALPLPATVASPPEQPSIVPSLISGTTATTTETMAATMAATTIADPAAARTAAIMRKRMQKRRQQMTMVVLLATVSFVLLCVLIYVLVFQVNSPPAAPQ